MVNQMCGTYSVGRRTNRWPLCLFFDLLNVAGINSEIIFKSLNINSPRVPRRIFLKNISQQLFQDHLKIRSQLKNLPRSIHDLIILYCKKAESPESQNLRNENGAMFAQVPKVVCHKLFATNAGDTYVNVILRIFAKIANNIRLQLLIGRLPLPAHVGIPGNKLADSLAKPLGHSEARKSSTQQDERELPHTINPMPARMEI
ncbi:hypothetical protein LAZ67_2005892 [Cordylochernes scorpioides]|uniref:RNase H type-1 domain-containing protein n=1 Tax=Cordylochernes scorpioides TaxID=51811 RepID=A0ABY6K510_9ARAC|nr:hypothetical protein LAZ67_2005892 [Cordylochernes scorpioides]